MNQTGKDYIIKKFEEKFKRGFNNWKPFFKNKYDGCKKKYTKFRQLTYNRTGLGYDEMGRLEMPDDWWEERIQEWSGARKYKDKVFPSMDLFEEEFRGVVVTGGEGWSAQNGEVSLNSRVDGDDDDDEADSVDKEISMPVVEKQTQPGSSRAKRRRKEKDATVEACVKRTKALEVKNKIAQELLEDEKEKKELERATRVDNVIATLNGLYGVTLWSPFHKAAVANLLRDEANRLAFMVFPRDEDKIKFMEFVTGTNVDD